MYFPKDPKTVEYHDNQDLEDVLAVIENIIETYQCENVLIAGDLNIDFKRKNGHVKRLDRFLQSRNLESSWKRFKVDYTHEFELDDKSYTSTIDHIIWNENLFANVLKAGVMHHPGNTSDHSPIFCKINDTCISDIKNNDKGLSNHVNFKSLKPSDWTDYTNIVDEKLRTTHIPDCVNCRNIHCKDISHVHDIDEYAMEILKIVDDNIKAIVRKKTNKTTKIKIVPGWNDEVKPFQEDAMFWHAIWESAGKPLNNQLHHIMKRTRNIYHYQIRKCKRTAEMIKKNKLLDACVNGNGDIFDELRKMRKVKCTVPQVMDGCKNVNETFMNVYKELYNSSNDKDETLEILDKVNDVINDVSHDDVDLVTAEIVELATNNIKPHKNDPIFAFNSDCIKSGPTSLFQHLSNMIRCFLIHGHVSKVLLLSTLVPLIKNKLGDSESSDNYRSIALSSIILKIFDWIVILLFGESLGLDDLQFSYQKDCSTTMCTWLVVESVSYFLRNDSDVFSCFMDMPKAFDMVHHSKLFKKLVDRKLSPIFTRLIIILYLS